MLIDCDLTRFTHQHCVGCAALLEMEDQGDNHAAYADSWGNPVEPCASCHESLCRECALKNPI